MHIPKPVLLGLGILAAIFFGWTLRGSTATATQVGPAVAAPTALQYPASSAPASAAPPPVYVTVVTPKSSAPAAQGDLAPRVETQFVSTPAPDAPVLDEAALAALIDAVTPDTVNTQPTDIQGPSEVNGLSIIANGDGVVIANDGAIISVGDNTVVHGNTGDATSSGSIGVDVTDSDVSTGNSGSTATTDPPVTDEPETPPTTDPSDPDPIDAPAEDASEAATTARAGGARRTRAVALKGLELRSLAVDGNENLLAYDESALFFHRRGTLNGNTGDTDTSGLNVVDATRSSVQSGSSTTMVAPTNPAPAPIVVSPGAPGSATVADGNGIATASGDDTLVIGGDGVHDRRVHMRGDRNVVIYDDAQAAIGGAGDVNVQIGDSAHGGTVVMKVVDSHIRAGDATTAGTAG